MQTACAINTKVDRDIVLGSPWTCVDFEVKRSKDGLQLGWMRGMGLHLTMTAHFLVTHAGDSQCMGRVFSMDVTKFAFAFDNMRPSNIFSTFDIRRMFYRTLCRMQIYEKVLVLRLMRVISCDIKWIASVTITNKSFVVTIQRSHAVTHKRSQCRPNAMHFQFIRCDETGT